jgi:glutamyl/glutaminyl-tRNA synthetase
MQVLQVLKDCLCSPKNENYFLEDVKVYVEALKHLNLKGEKLYKPIRLLLTGALHGPELKELLPMIPKHSAVERIEKIEKALKKAPI